jgi:hypothetical protein
MSKPIEIAPPGVRATIDALLEKYCGRPSDAPHAVQPRRLAAVGARMAMALVDVTRQYGKTLDGGQVAGINDLLHQWDEAIADAGTVLTWRARIGAGEDFPIHVPSCVERAMMNEIADLRDQLVPAGLEGSAS